LSPCVWFWLVWSLAKPTQGDFFMLPQTHKLVKYQFLCPGLDSYALKRRRIISESERQEVLDISLFGTFFLIFLY
jgi:hypothetical protein